MEDNGIVIVGGGLAAQRCAETLRRRGYEGAVRVVCAEPEPPYDRPPLSKELLAGEAAEEAVVLDGDPAGRDFEAVFTRGGVPVAGLAVGRPRAIPALKKRIDSGHFPAADRKEKEAVA
jgi:3-phenylpropionate/trans-cinnamate dioxygenase ferredoxin reductase subunit